MSRKPNQKEKGPKPEGFRKNKFAFDSVMGYLRRMDRPYSQPLIAVNAERRLGGGSSATERNPAKPTLLDFWCDVFRAIKVSIPKDIDMVKFHIAYTLFDSEDYIECELHAQEILHDRRHSVEQRLGAEFIRRKIFPVQGRGYFYAPRNVPRRAR